MSKETKPETKPETTKEILEKYPELFGTDFDPRVSLMGFGFEVGKGWRDIIVSYLPRLSKTVKENNLNYRILQVKEKFGSLSIYSDGYYDQTDFIIDQIEEDCSKNCEKCGNPGTFKADGWYRVTCSECEKEFG